MSNNPLKDLGAFENRIAVPKDKAERERFLIERGNRLLAEQGSTGLHWVCVNGHYSIQPKW